MEENLTGFRWALHRVENTVDTNQESLENFHRKLEHVKGAVNNNKDSLQKLHRNLEAVKGAVDSNQVSLRSAVNNNQNSLQRIHELTKNCLGKEDLEQFKNISEVIHKEVKNCLGREDLEHFKNISSAGQQQLEISLRQEISGVISSLETGGIEMQKKFGHVENNLHELHRNLEHVKGAVDSNQVSLQSAVNKTQDSLEMIHQETKDCLGREDLEHFKNISSAGKEDMESFLRQEITGVISLLETDECSEGSHNCSDHEACTDKPLGFSCSCLPGFARDGLRCEDIDECAGGRAECSPQATCRNSVGSYSCSCNPPFEGDGRTCEFSCESPAKVLEGLGCVRLVEEAKTWQEMAATCHEAGGRLLQDFNAAGIREVRRVLSIHGLVWVGSYEGKWQESGIALQEELRWPGYQTDPSKLCGIFTWIADMSSFKVAESVCSEKRNGFCQFLW